MTTLFATIALLARQATPPPFAAYQEPNKLFIAHVSPESSGAPLDGGRPEWMQRLGLTARFSVRKTNGFAWDSSKLLPTFIPSEGDVKEMSAARALGSLFGAQDFDAAKLLRANGAPADDPNQGALVSSFPAKASDVLGATIPGVGEVSSFDDTRVVVQFDVFVEFCNTGWASRILPTKARTSRWRVNGATCAASA